MLNLIRITIVFINLFAIGEAQARKAIPINGKLLESFSENVPVSGGMLLEAVVI